MARVPEAFKATMKSHGLWEEFCRVRDEYKASGISPAESRDRAIEEFSDRVSDLPLSGSVEGGGSVSSACCPDSGSSTILDSDLPGPEFLGKTASIVDVISWVAKHLEADESVLRLRDAPSMEAWGMLLSYRRTVGRKDEFWDKVFTKLIPSRAQLESHHTIDSDGSGVVEAIDRILDIKRKSELETPVGQ